MPIKFNCYKCGANLRVPEKHIGKKARCPKCDEKCVVPEVSVRSQSGSQPGIGPDSEFEDIGNFLDQPVAAAAPVGIPVAAPFAAAPPMATPVAAPPMMSPTVPPVGVKSPYTTPAVGKSAARGGGLAGSVMQPLYEARTMMKIVGWMMFIGGILQCITIVYAIIGWLPIWMGWLLKGAAEAVETGIESGDKNQLRLASEKLGTYFKIMGVLAIIWLVFAALALLFFFGILLLGGVGAFAG